MTDETVETEDAPKKASKLPLIIGLVLALAGGGGGFYAVYSGMILGDDSAAVAEQAGGQLLAPDNFDFAGRGAAVFILDNIDQLYAQFLAQFQRLITGKHQAIF